MVSFRCNNATVNGNSSKDFTETEEPKQKNSNTGNKKTNICTPERPGYSWPGPFWIWFTD